MASQLQNKILKALFIALQPLARALIKAGIGHREFSSVAKAVFVKEATEAFGVRGRPTNVSRIAVLTGLNRKEIRRIRDEDLAGDSFNVSVHESPASIILSRWHSDARFCDSEAVPKILEFDSAADSFTSLVAEYAGDVPAGAMRTELKRIGAIEEDGLKRLTVKKRHYVPNGLDEKLVIGLEEVLSAELSTLAFNCDPDTQHAPRFHRVASIDGMSEGKIEAVRKKAKEDLVELAESFDAYLVVEAEEGFDFKNEKSPIQVGIGLFYYEKKL